MAAGILGLYADSPGGVGRKQPVSPNSLATVDIPVGFRLPDLTITSDFLLGGVLKGQENQTGECNEDFEEA